MAIRHQLTIFGAIKIAAGQIVQHQRRRLLVGACEQRLLYSHPFARQSIHGFIQMIFVKIVLLQTAGGGQGTVSTTSFQRKLGAREKQARKNHGFDAATVLRVVDSSQNIIQLIAFPGILKHSYPTKAKSIMQAKRITGNKATRRILQKCTDGILDMGRKFADIADGTASGAIGPTLTLTNRFAFVELAVDRCFGRLNKHIATQCSLMSTGYKRIIQTISSYICNRLVTTPVFSPPGWLLTDYLHFPRVFMPGIR